MEYLFSPKKLHSYLLRDLSSFAYFSEQTTVDKFSQDPYDSVALYSDPHLTASLRAVDAKTIDALVSSASQYSHKMSLQSISLDYLGLMATR